MSYFDRYIKYKSKYLKLKLLDSTGDTSQINSGGKRKMSSRERKIQQQKRKMSSWERKVQQRKKELNIKSTKSYIKFEQLSSRDKIYYIHDNFSRPFKVICNNQGISIYRSEQPDIYSKLITKIKAFQGYWSGFDSSPYVMHGNSLLVKITKKKYIYIGPEIYEFSTDDEITDYVSPIGNSDVPYPVAFGEVNVYFMLDKQYISINDLETPVTVAEADTLYGEFYGFVGSKRGNHTKYPFKRIKMIEKRLLWGRRH